MQITNTQLKALSQILKKDLSGLSLGINYIKDGELWHEPVSYHPWKDRVYNPSSTGIKVDASLKVAMNLLAEKILKESNEKNKKAKKLEEINKELHNSMIGESWLHDFDGCDIEIQIDHLGWTCGGCSDIFPKHVQTKEEAIETISKEAEDQLSHSMGIM